MNHWIWGASNSSPKGDIGFGLFGNDNCIPDAMDKDVDIAKKVDNLFSRRAYDSDDWLMTLRSAAAAGVPPAPSVDYRRFEPAESFSRAGSLYSSNSDSNSSSESGTPWPDGRHSQLDFTMLREFEIMQKCEEFSKQISPEPRKMFGQGQGLGSPTGRSQGPFERSMKLERTPEKSWSGPSTLGIYDPEYQDDPAEYQDGGFRDGYGYYGRPRNGRPGRRICKFCYKNGERADWYTTHSLYERNSNIVACPVLRNYECKQCGATGDHAHTDSYCPYRERAGGNDSRVTTYYGSTNYASTGMSRRPQSGEEPSWHQEDFPPLGNFLF